MNRRELLQASAALPALALLPACATSTDASMTNTPPVARIEPKTIEQLGRTRVDNYAWLKDDNWQQVMRDPSVLRTDVREYLDAENAYREAVMALLSFQQGEDAAGPAGFLAEMGSYLHRAWEEKNPKGLAPAAGV